MSVAPVLDVRGRNGREGQSTEQVLRPQLSSVQFNSVAQLCLTLCTPMNRSTPGLPIHHQLMEFTQTHVHRVSDAIQPSHPLSSLSPPAPNPSQHQSLFQCSALSNPATRSCPPSIDSLLLSGTTVLF